MTRPIERSREGVRIDPAYSLDPGRLAWDPTTEEPSPEDILVTAAFHFLTKNGALDFEKARELGRALGMSLPPGQFTPFLNALSHLGLGKLALASQERARYLFRSENLAGAERGRSSSCGIALGFAEGLVRAETGRDALGAEMECRSRGAHACTFVVIVKPGG